MEKYITDGNNKFFKEFSERIGNEGKVFSKPHSLIDNQLELYSPFSNNLDDEIKLKIYLEAKNNIWYFLREIVRYIDYNKKVSLLPMSDAFASITTCYEENINIFTNICRQSLSTTFYCAILLHNLIFKNNICIIDSNKENAKLTKNKIIEMKNLLPEYIVDISRSDHDNKDYKINILSPNDLDIISFNNESFILEDTGICFIDNAEFISLIVNLIFKIKMNNPNCKIFCNSTISDNHSTQLEIIKQCEKWNVDDYIDYNDKYKESVFDKSIFNMVHIVYNYNELPDIIHNPLEYKEKMLASFNGDENIFRRECELLRKI